MKKISISFVLFFLLVIFDISSFAASQGELVVSNVNGKPGETVSVTISIKNNPGIIAMRLNVGYDNSQVSLVEVSDGKLLGNGNALFNNNINTVPYTLLWEDALAAENYTRDGVLATLKFKISDSASSGKVDIRVDIDTSSTFDKNLVEKVFYVSNGSIVINGGSEKITQINQTKEEKETTQVQTKTETTVFIESIYKTSEYSASSNALPICKHLKTEWVTIKEPTCNMEGRKKLVCHDCGLILKVENILITEHLMSEWATSSRTESDNTIETRCCNDCDYQETRELAENDTVIIVYNNSEELTQYSSGTINFEQAEQSDKIDKENEQSLKDTTETQKEEKGIFQNHKNTLIIVFAIVLLIVVSVILLILKHKKEKV